MFSNPIIKRYQFSQLRPQSLWIFGTLYTGIVLLIFFINTSIYHSGGVYSSGIELFESYFVQFFILQMLLSCLIMPINCSNVVPKEISNKSFDFFRMLPLSAFKKATGIMVGRNLFSLLAICINLVFCVFFGIAADISGQMLIQLFTLWVMTTLLLTLSSFLFSIISFNNTKTTSIPLIILALFAFGPILGGFFEALENDIQQSKTYFLDFEIPVLFLISAYFFIAATWLFTGILRRFKHEYESLFNFKGAILFMGSYLFLIYALFHHEFFAIKIDNWGYNPVSLFFSFAMVTLPPMLFIPFVSIRNFDKYIEKTRLAKNKNNLVTRLFLNSNLFQGIALFILWLVTTLSVASGIKIDLALYFCLAAMVFSAYLILLCLIESYVVIAPKNEKIGYLLSFLGGLYVILPMILSGVFDNEYIMMFSPVGMLFTFKNFNGIGELMPVIVLNWILCLLPLLLIFNKYFEIVRLRFAIESKTSNE